MGSDPRLYNESLFVARGIRKWNWEFRRVKRMGIQRRKTEYYRESKNEN
jgi:hypothetical protein